MLISIDRSRGLGVGLPGAAFELGLKGSVQRMQAGPNNLPPVENKTLPNFTGPQGNLEQNSSQYLTFLQEGDLGGERVTVEYDRQTVLTVPTVQLYTPTPCTGYLTLYCAVCTIIAVS